MERTPTYLRDYLKTYHQDEYDFYFVDLPFYIHLDEIDVFFGGTLNKNVLDELIVQIKESNKAIENLLKSEKYEEYRLKNWGVIDPATARLLSKPVEIYMEAMMEHPNVKVQLGQIF